VVWENVPGILSSNGGRDFGAFLWALGQLGYGFAYRVLDAQYFGVPQRRRRVFVVGCLGDWRRPAAVLFERHSLSGHPAPRRQTGTRASALSASRFGRGGADDNAAQARHLVAARVAPTLDASFGRLQGCSGQDAKHGHAHLIAFGGNNTAGPIEVATACNAHAGRYDFESETLIAHPTGAAEAAPVSFPMEFSNQGFGEDLSVSITTRPTAVAFSCKDHGADAGEVSPTLRSIGHDASHANGGGQVAIAIQERAESIGPGGPQGKGWNADVAFTMEARRRPQSVAFSMAVRRLTPRECERLQGFPDDYTLIPSDWRSRKPSDWLETVAYLCAAGFGRAEAEALADTPDGPRYHALGNSKAVPVVRWIGERIDRVDAMDFPAPAAGPVLSPTPSAGGTPC
jgi:DNA (cytosine-5)-methyltransferase 1